MEPEDGSDSPLLEWLEKCVTDTRYADSGMEPKNGKRMSLSIQVPRSARVIVIGLEVESRCSN